jgi:hypothetical protein
MPMTGKGGPLGSRQWDRAGGAVVRGREGCRGTGGPSRPGHLAIHFTIPPTYFEPAEHQGIITPMLFYHTLHDALVKPMPGNIMAPSQASASPALGEDRRTHPER